MNYYTLGFIFCIICESHIYNFKSTTNQLIRDTQKLPLNNHKSDSPFPCMILINELYLNTLTENCSSTTMLFENPPQTMVSGDQYGDASGGLGFESTQHHSRPGFT